MNGAGDGRDRARRAFDALEESVARSRLPPERALAGAAVLGVARATLSRRWPSAKEVRDLFGARALADRRIALAIAAREAMSRLVVRRVSGRTVEPFAPLVSWRDPTDAERLRPPAILLNFHVGALHLFSAAFNHLPARRTVLRWSEVHRPAATERAAALHGGLAARTRALLEARAELRAGGYVSTTLDGGFGASQTVPFLGRTLAAGVGPFLLARETGVPIVPVVALWRGTRAACERGDPVHSAAEAAAWLERLLRREPAQISLGLLRHLLFEPAVGATKEKAIP